MKKLLLLVLIFIPFISIAQVQIEDFSFIPNKRGINDGKITIYQDSKIVSVVEKHIKVNNNKFSGWRVQLFFGSGSAAMAKVNSIKTSFRMKYGNQYGAYIIYEAPYFKLRVGDFRTRAEAMYFSQQIAKNHSTNWVVKDRIYYPNRENKYIDPDEIQKDEKK